MRTQDQQMLRLLVRSREDFQSMRKRLDNRIGRKADKTSQNIDARNFLPEDVIDITEISDAARAQEEVVAKKLKTALKRFPVYEQWLKLVTGVAEIASGWLLGEFDIQVATTVSKMWHYAGLNPGMVLGKKCIKIAEYEEIMGKIIKEVKFREHKYYIVLTDQMVRGDKATPDFILPFNKRLRTALVGVLAAGFIKCQSSYALEFYYPYKARLEQEQNKVGDKAWSEVSKGHRDRAAKRYMIKMFLKDFYVAWRSAEGLEVRKPFNEEYLGHKHTSEPLTEIKPKSGKRAAKLKKP